MTKLKQFDLGWVVGIYDGEGSVSSRKNGKTDKHYPYIEVGMTDLDTMERFASLLPGGNLTSYVRHHKYRKTQYQEIYRYRVTRRDLVLQYIEMLRPHVCARRQAQFEEVLAR